MRKLIKFIEMDKEKKYYVVKTIHLPFVRESSIFNGWISDDKDRLIELVRINIEQNSFKPTKIELTEDNWLIVNGSSEQWLNLIELKFV